MTSTVDRILRSPSLVRALRARALAIAEAVRRRGPNYATDREVMQLLVDASEELDRVNDEVPS